MTDTPSMESLTVSVEEEVADTSMGRPHVVLLGAGASKAALPDGDKNGVPVPLLRDVAEDLGLFGLFPENMRDLARTDFESAYSQLVDLEGQEEAVAAIDEKVGEYFSALELPEEPNLYDVLQLCLREKDAIFTFNWDPFLIQSRSRLAQHGAKGFPKLFFLHGNVLVGFCVKDATSGLVGRRCSQCGEYFEPSRLLFPVEKKNYQDGHLVEREWRAMSEYLKACFMFTIFGYSAPQTDVEAIDLLKGAWGSVEDRSLEQTEIINRPGADEDTLREKWDPFIHTHHYEIHGSFYDSWMAKHPRRTGEAYWNQYMEAKFIEDNPVPQGFPDIPSLVDWFRPLMDVE